MTNPPAENPIIPTRSGEIPHSGACCRTYVTAANPSATARWFDGLHGLIKFLLVCVQGAEFLSGVFAGVRNAILQYKCGHAFCGQVFGDIRTLACDGKGHKTAARDR